MNAAFSEIPLAIFTTLAPIGAGAFIALAIALIQGNASDKQLQHVDKWIIVPVLFTLVGLGASVLHLGDPMHMLNVVFGLGSSPLANEVFVGCILIVVALVFAFLGLAGKLSAATRKIFGIIVGVIAVVFVVFTGMAYMVSTISSWESPLDIVQMCGFALVGGAAFLPIIMGESEGLGSLASGVVAIIGALLAVIGLAGTAFITNGLSNAAMRGTSLVGEALPYIIAGLVLIVASAVCTWMTTKKNTRALAWIALACAIVGIFLARLAFYGMQLSVGLSL